MRVAVGHDKQVVVYIEDSGPGIPIEKRPELFTKYQPSLDLLKQGSGLGLSLCKRLMSAMCGDEWLEETYDSGIAGCPGARFVIELNVAPLDVESTALEESDSESHQETSGRYTNKEFGLLQPDNLNCVDNTRCPTVDADLESQHSIYELPTELSVLFVDDDTIIRKLFTRAIKKAQPSWSVQEASSGEAALKLCDEESFDLIFMDQYMASVDVQLLGTETTQKLRSRGVVSTICGLSANDVRESFMQAGADDFVLKPLPAKPDLLRDALRDILQNADTSKANVVVRT